MFSLRTIEQSVAVLSTHAIFPTQRGRSSTVLFQALHNDLGVASKGLKDNIVALEAACEERSALLQQVHNETVWVLLI